MRFESEKITVPEPSLAAFFYESPVVHMFLDTMTKVAAKIEVLISPVFYGLIDGPIKLMHDSFRCSNFYHKSVKVSLSIFAIA
jgi:hypothetical protein